MTFSSPSVFTAEDYANRLPEGCGVVGVYGAPNAAQLAYLALYAMQHRGQESCGVATWDGEQMHLHKGQGLVSKVLDEETIAGLPGTTAIGHVRYSTTGSSTANNAQPLRANYRGGHMAVAHNGNLTNADELARALEANGAIFQSTTDSELLVHLVAQNRAAEEFEEALRLALKRLKGAFSMTILHDGNMYAVKDPYGFRPLCVGKLPAGGWMVASESCALDVCGAQYLREMAPGEVIRFQNDDLDKYQMLESNQQAFCVFELIYYSRPDSMMAGSSIYRWRKELGRELAREHPAKADVVIAVPDSSNAASLGYAEESGIPWEIGLVRSHYIGRTFIQPQQSQRDFGVKMKFNCVQEVLRNKSVVVVDDSVVRGTTARKIVRFLRESGAREIHFRVSAPPWKHPCFYGIDTPDEEQLLANIKTEDQIREWMGLDSLGFISLEGLMRAMPKTISYCTTCFTGRYWEGRPLRKTKHLNGTRVAVETAGSGVK